VIYLLDTNAVIALLKDHPPSVRQAFRRAMQDRIPIAVSSIVLFELWYGVAKSRQAAENSERLRIFLSGGLDIIFFDEEDAKAAGSIRASLEGKGTPIGPYDVLIAGQAVRHGARLVTANTNEFARVKGLDWEDWSPKA
jgi:tRNA(fMet)-specific endonuclease VapC